MKQEIKILLVVSAVTIAILAGAVLLLGGSTSPNQGTKVADQTILIRADSNKMGSESAKIKLVEFGDYQCPACGAAYPVITQILSTYKNDTLFVFRNYPLSIHANSTIAAKAAEAAGVQGKYWQMYDALYQNQSTWSTSNSPIDVFTSYAKTMGLDTEKFKQDVQSNKFDAKIQEDTNDGNSVGVNATPTFYLNGKQIVGVPNYNNLKKDIDALLK